MVLENSYFTVLERSDVEGGVRFRVRMEEGHEVYRGHFPGNPVSPGVCNMQMVRECAEMVSGVRLRFVKIGQYRLMGVIAPGRYPEVEVTVAMSEAGGEWELRATVTGGEEVLIQMKAVLTERKGCK